MLLRTTYTLALLAISLTALAEPNTTDMQFGAIQISQSSQKKLHHSGVLQLDNVKVEGDTLINGYLLAKNSSFHDLTVNGQCQLENTELLGPLSINGQLQLKNVNAEGPITVYGFLGARNTQFAKPITITSANLDLIDSNAQNITIEPVKDLKQTLNLTRSTVNGDITFTSGKGIVKVDPASSIKGKVKGGTIEKVAAKPEEKRQ
ncbi:hypothetical protein [Candidatus Berkiella aquae]|uniref:Lipopolysaccharide export system protein LptA n=1 Tax=Candidatus Berkiella aquae TaxID=295108 RepID=A0A0Q9YKL3_9GAMM|nr:hypothetical protein [Candidatus Berkiella aquae]MCS5711096.1 hypothetical protein [Candidatus Berkiella aquae]